VITTRDIAERLQLSVSTVGRALADDKRISDQTKFRVRQAAAEMGYVANRAARMMRGASSDVVGLVVPDIRNTFYATVAHELSKNMGAQGFQLMLAETDDDKRVELGHLREMSASRVAGLIIVPTARPHGESVKLLRTIPHVQLLRKRPSLGAQWFGVDDRAALRLATAHLVQLGHGRIGYIGGPTELSTGADRLMGFRDALKAGRLRAAPEHIELVPPASAELGGQALRRLLAARSAPTAIALGSVQLTRGVLDELHRMDVAVPSDLSVVGFGDEPGFAWWGPGLTTTGLPIQEIAAACGLWLIRRLTTNPNDDTAYTSMSPGSLIVRGSSAAPSRGRRTSR
jgi:DNA-binding LacI/PurR family transcriptional regulator